MAGGKKDSKIPGIKGGGNAGAMSGTHTRVTLKTEGGPQEKWI